MSKLIIEPGHADHQYWRDSWTYRELFANRTDIYFAAELTFEVRFTHHLVGNAFSQFRTLNSNGYDGFNNNQISAQLTWEY